MRQKLSPTILCLIQSRVTCLNVFEKWIIGLENTATARSAISYWAQNNHPSTHPRDPITASKYHVPLLWSLPSPLSDRRGLRLAFSEQRITFSAAATTRLRLITSFKRGVKNFCTEPEVCAFMLQQPCVKKWHLGWTGPFGEAWYAVCCQDVTKKTVALFKKQGTAQGINS